jgi:hypothetical protein
MGEIGGERKGKGGVGHQVFLYCEHLLSNADERLVKASQQTAYTSLVLLIHELPRRFLLGN